MADVVRLVPREDKVRGTVRVGRGKVSEKRARRAASLRHIHPAVMKEALRLAEGDRARLVPDADGSVTVVNNPTEY